MKKSEMVITFTKSVTFSAETETTETVQTLELVEGGNRRLIKRESAKTVKPIDLSGELFREAA